MLEFSLSLAGLSAWALKIYSWIHIAAFVLSWISADRRNPIVFWIYRLTVPLWNWVGQKLSRPWVSFAPILALMLVIFGEMVVPGAIRSLGATMSGRLALDDGMINIVLYLVYGTLVIASSVIGFVFFLALIWFVFTLVNPPTNNPLVRAILVLIDPLITPIQRMLPRARIDLSPLVLALIAFLLRYGLNRVILPVQAGLMI